MLSHYLLSAHSRVAVNAVVKNSIRYQQRGIYNLGGSKSGSIYRRVAEKSTRNAASALITQQRDYTEKPTSTLSNESSLPTDDNAGQSSISSNTKARNNGVKVTAYANLAKAKLSALVVSTTAAGYLATTAEADVLAAVLTGTFLCSASAAALNQIYEITNDKRMKRTQARPLVIADTNSHLALTKSQAITAATLWGASGTAILYAFTNPVTTALGASNIALYAGLYTYSKQHTVYNTWIGAVVGAIPPVMGYTAATGGDMFHDPSCWILAATLYCWQMPHFFALSYMHRVDYERGGFVMLPSVSSDKTANVMVRYAWYLSTIPFISTLAGTTSSMFACEGVLLNAYALYVTHKFQREQTNANARKVFLTSLWYLPTFMVLFLLHSKIWDEDCNKQQQSELLQSLSSRVLALKETGRNYCLHESAATNNEKACPVVVAAVTGQKGSEKAKVVLNETADQVLVIKNKE